MCKLKLEPSGAESKWIKSADKYYRGIHRTVAGFLKSAKSGRSSWAQASISDVQCNLLKLIHPYTLNTKVWCEKSALLKSRTSV